MQTKKLDEYMQFWQVDLLESADYLYFLRKNMASTNSLQTIKCISFQEE